MDIEIRAQQCCRYQYYESGNLHVIIPQIYIIQITIVGSDPGRSVSQLPLTSYFSMRFMRVTSRARSCETRSEPTMGNHIICIYDNSKILYHNSRDEKNIIYALNEPIKQEERRSPLTRISYKLFVKNNFFLLQTNNVQAILVNGLLRYSYFTGSFEERKKFLQLQTKNMQAILVDGLLVDGLFWSKNNVF